MAVPWVVVLGGARSAIAHEDDESTDANKVVRQAIEDKVTHALEVDDHEGADADLVHQAGVALGAGDLHQTRPLLERSISA